MMIQEAYVSFEVAKLLKEKGFNEKCRGGYHYEFDDNDNPIVMLEEWTAQPYNNDFVDEGFLCSAPTHQMAIKWLREEKNICIIIEPCSYDAVNEKILTYSFSLWEGDNYCENPEAKGYSSYEEAVDEALKYVLENLI